MKKIKQIPGVIPFASHRINDEVFDKSEKSGFKKRLGDRRENTRGMMIDEAFNCFKKREIIESQKTITVKFTDTGKYFKVRRADYKGLAGGSPHRRCQTAYYVKEVIESGTPRNNKDVRVVRRELLPQTKAHSPCKQLDFIHFVIKGNQKDITIRRIGRSKAA